VGEKKPKVITTPERSRLMSKVRQSHTAPEREVRKILHKCGFRFRVKAKDLPGTPDVVNRAGKWAIFIHGCFWHAHEGCYRWKIPKSNSDFWHNKFLDNRARDERKTNNLKELGYSVLVVWQCELDDLIELQKKLTDFVKTARLKL
jgi:DNA mismatch endonuclease (patch repair protein)